MSRSFRRIVQVTQSTDNKHEARPLVGFLALYVRVVVPLMGVGLVMGSPFTWALLVLVGTPLPIAVWETARHSRDRKAVIARRPHRTVLPHRTRGLRR